MPNSAWNYPTGNYTVNLGNDTNPNGTISLSTDGSGNLNSSATWTPNGQSTGVSVTVSWDGTYLNWSVGNHSFSQGQCTEISPLTKFSGGYTAPGRPTGGTGTWTATH